jgi:Domain of unknown function (DUF1707)
MEGTPELRASDADRERIAELLRHAAGEGRLTVDELDGRLDAAYASRTRAELDRLVADVVPADVGDKRALPVIPAGEGATKWLISVLSGHDRRGRWRVAPKLINFCFWGGSEIDLNDAELTAPHTEIQVIAIMGGSTVYVPEGLDVTVSEVAIMGGNSVTLGDDRPLPGGPTVHIRLISVMAGSDVRRGRRLSRVERRERREARRLERRRRRHLRH